MEEEGYNKEEKVVDNLVIIDDTTNIDEGTIRNSPSVTFEQEDKKFAGPSKPISRQVLLCIHDIK